MLDTPVTAALVQDVSMRLAQGLKFALIIFLAGHWVRTDHRETFHLRSPLLSSRRGESARKGETARSSKRVPSMCREKTPAMQRPLIRSCRLRGLNCRWKKR